MKASIVKVIYRPVIKSAARSALIGRNRDFSDLERGRFSSKDVDLILKQVWKEYDQLAPSAPVMQKFGNQMNVMLACVTYACFQVLLDKGINRDYAIELIGDVAWKVYKKWSRLAMFFSRLRTRDPKQQLRQSVKLFLRFPFTPPAYQFKLTESDQGISLDMLKCPVAEYFHRQNATDLCIGTWCNLDFPLAEMWGGRLERSKTLAAGYDRCDFRFRIQSANKL